MLIDWFTVGAQIVNFLLLVWLLKRYLYRPILAAIDAREKELATRREAAAGEQTRATKEHEEWQSRHQLLESQQAGLLETARQAAAAERENLLKQAEAEAEQLRSVRLAAVTEQVAAYQEDLIDLTRREIAAAVRKIIRDLACSELEQAAMQVFLRRLHDDPTPAAADAGPGGSTSLMRLRTAVALPEPERLAVEKQIQAHFKTSAALVCETAADLGLGMELTFRNRKVAWTLDEYMTSFKAHLSELARQSPSRASPAP